MSDSTPEGVRYNNPGNLERVGNVPWQGLAAVQTHPVMYEFKDPVYGMRAVVCQMIAYQDKHGCKTVMDAISRFAPPSDNNPTQIYALNVAAEIGAYPGNVAVDSNSTEVDWHKYNYVRPALEAIIKQENGAAYTRWYSSAQLDKACVLAGVEPPKKNVIASAQVLGSTMAGVAISAQPVVDTLKSQLQPLTDYSNAIRHTFIVVSLIGVVIAAWAKINERNKGIS